MVKEYWLNGKNKSSAYAKVFAKDPDGKNLRRMAYRVFQAPGVKHLLKQGQEAAEVRVKRVLDKHAITEARITEELAKIAFSNPREIMSWGPDGVVLKKSEELTEGAVGAVSEVSASSGKNGTSVKVKQHDKVQALLSLGKALGMFKEEKQEGPKMAVQFVINRGD